MDGSLNKRRRIKYTNSYRYKVVKLNKLYVSFWVSPQHKNPTNYFWKEIANSK